MGKSAEMFMQQRELEADDREYFVLMSEQEWEIAILDEEQRLRDTYGNSLKTRLEFEEFLTKNSYE